MKIAAGEQKDTGTSQFLSGRDINIASINKTMDPDGDNPNSTKRSLTESDSHPKEAAGGVAKKAKKQNNESRHESYWRKCKECLQVKCRREYSKKQFHYANKGEGTCNECRQKVLIARAGLSLPPTLTCSMCKKAKGTMTEYSKKERSQGDLAKCKYCVEIDGTLTCASCNEEKERVLFDSQERRKEARAKCISCCEREQREMEEIMRARIQAENERRRAEYEQKERIRKQQIDANGPQIKMPTFQVPGCGGGPFDDSEYVCPYIEFENSSQLPVESLIGEYDLIFYYTKEFDELCWRNRATKGCLKFEMDDQGKLHGSLSVNKELRSDMPYHMGDEVRIGPDFMVSNIEEIITLDDVSDVSVSIERVAKRHAVKYMPEGDGLPKMKPQKRKRGKKYIPYTTDDEDDQPNFLRDYYDSIQFETTEEAQIILDRYNQAPLWMTNHLKLPSSLLLLIQEFVGRYKPIPVLFFEKGDLFVEIQWFEHICEGYSSTFVARPRHPVVELLP